MPKMYLCGGWGGGCGGEGRGGVGWGGAVNLKIILGTVVIGILWTMSMDDDMS